MVALEYAVVYNKASSSWLLCETVITNGMVGVLDLPACLIVLILCPLEPLGFLYRIVEVTEGYPGRRHLWFQRWSRRPGSPSIERGTRPIFWFRGKLFSIQLAEFSPVRIPRRRRQLSVPVAVFFGRRRCCFDRVRGAIRGKRYGSTSFWVDQLGPSSSR